MLVFGGSVNYKYQLTQEIHYLNVTDLNVTWIGLFIHTLDVLQYGSGLKHSVKVLIIFRQCLQSYGLLYIVVLAAHMISSNFGK